MASSLRFHLTRRIKSTRRPSQLMVEGLESRLLLYSSLGAHFVYGSRITFSFVPDGTSIGGTPSVLFQSLNSKFSTTVWQQQFQKAAAVWQAVANINIAQVGDDGSPLGVDGNQQGDSRFGDIRISAISLGGSALATCYLPPSINGGTDAGDIVLNSTVNWQLNSSYDLQTVAIHELGHALGLGHSAITTACMYAYYNSVKQSLTTDDVIGAQAVWQSPLADIFNSDGLSNGTYLKASNLTSFIDTSSQISIPDLRLTSASQSEWFSVTAPASTTGTMEVTMQAGNLSMLSPKLAVYTTGLSLLGTQTSNIFGGTISVSISGVQPGQTFYIRANGNTSYSASGGFGLQVNFGSRDQPPIAPPFTTVPQQPDQGGGALGLSAIRTGNHTGYGETLEVGNSPRSASTPSGGTAPSAEIAVPYQTQNIMIGVLDTTPSTVTTATSSQTKSSEAVTCQSTPAPVAAPLVNEVVDTVLSDWNPRSKLGGLLG